MQKIELLSPAKNLLVGKAAIDNGADAVYVGAPAFGARKSAANSVEDIAMLVDYAHRYNSRVFVALNTVLYDTELAEAERLIKSLYAVEVDALIVQDMSILRMDIPPIVLHASTQMHNYDIERIKFLDTLGFRRIVLAREMSLAQIREVRRMVKAELEVFIHGALCVSMSGQCYMSQYLSGRSANRGECAQPCRMKWSVKDNAGKSLVNDRYVLSLKDLNMTNHIAELVEAGVDSLKIEGRLKEVDYVANATKHYDNVLQRLEVLRSSSGVAESVFEADPARSFNRGYSDYFAIGRPKQLVNSLTPKSMGKYVGKAIRIQGCRLWLDGEIEIHNGDGLCFVDREGLKGIKVNTVDGGVVTANEPLKVAVGTLIYRNYDHQFVTMVERQASQRKIKVNISVNAQYGSLHLMAYDEDENQVTLSGTEIYEPAKNSSQKEQICRQLSKSGDTIYKIESVDYQGDVLFIPSAKLNECRRQLLNLLEQKRLKNRIRWTQNPLNNSALCAENIDWKYNVTNVEAEAFYRQHGAQQVERGFELTNDYSQKTLMTTKYCILHELGLCRKQNPMPFTMPLWLSNGTQRFLMEVDCKKCEMRIIGE